MHRELSSNIIDGLQDALEADDVSIPTPEILADLLDQLRGEEKLLLLLKYQEEWSTHSIQETLQLPEGVVKMRLSRTKDKLRKLLQNRNAKTNT